ncbi:peptide-methionine (S)-S-oxide reductase MsrA [Acholeplasma hippikon]|nr:peptide-methionine (S)-S-oxide reductase MsrA [Acholeplasma hippikon]
MKKIILAGGCFWGVEAYFKQIKGVLDTSCGYANGNKENPTYREVCDGVATHAEAVEILYDENETNLDKIFEHFFRIIDPTTLNRQGHDVGVQYRSGIYYLDEETKEKAIEYINKEQAKYDKKIVVSVEPLTNYYLAEAYHQDYLDKNPTGYCHVDLSLAKEDEKK